MPQRCAWFFSLPNGRRRVIAALIAFVGAAYVPAVWLAFNSSGLIAKNDLVAVFAMSLVFMWFSAMFTALFAVLPFALLLRAGKVGPWSSALAGALVGIGVAVVLPLGMSWPYYESAVQESAPLLAAVGAVAGAIFFALLIGVSHLLQVENPLLRPTLRGTAERNR